MESSGVLKLIECRVPPERADQFIEGQRGWSALRGVDGFTVQLGGWCLDPVDVEGRCRLAVIIALWRDRGCYERFMRDDHDRIFAAHDQRESYDAIDVTLWEPSFDIPGLVPGLDRAAGDARIMRLARCVVRAEHVAHFRGVQERVWNPGMREAGGMVGGVFCTATDRADHALVCTLWRSREAHQAYVTGVLPSLRRRANAGRDCRTVTGRIVSILPEWLVTGRPD